MKAEATGGPKGNSDCPLCIKTNKENKDHFIFKCPNYSTPSDKVKLLKSLGGCTKCARLNHTAVNCNFRFKKRCSLCSGWHMNYVCVPNPESAKSNPQDVNSGVAVMPNLSNCSILPTFISALKAKEAFSEG